MAGVSEIFVEGKKTLLTIEQNSRRAATDKNKALEAMLRSHQTRIRVVGCGGGGNNTISRLMESEVNGIETLAINTDAQDLLAATADDKILIGQNITKGLGAGSNPQIGEDAARENQPEIEEALLNSDLVFVTCGLGGGTGTGSAPVVAEMAKKTGALTISIVTLPFTEEGISRWENAKLGLEKLRQNSDTVIVIQNDRLLEVVPDLPLGTAFKVADEILVNAVKGITELITEKGLVNLDFADVRAIMQNGGTAMIGIGESDGAESAQAAVASAMQNKLLDLDITGAKSALINITGGAQMPLKDAKMVMKCVAEKLDPSARIIWGARIDQNLGKAVRVMLIATGVHEKREPAAGRPAKSKAGESAKPAMPVEVREPQTPSALLENAARADVFDLESAASEIAASGREMNIGDQDIVAPPPVSPALREEEASVNTPTAPKRKRKSPALKIKRPLENLITGKQVLQLVEDSEPAPSRDNVVRVTYADALALPENHRQAPAPVAGESSPATKINDELRTQLNIEKPVSPRAVNDSPAHPAKAQEPPAQRHEPAPRGNMQTPATTPAANGMRPPAPGQPNDRLNPAAKRTAPLPGKTGVYNKIFAEQSRMHLQIIRETIGHLFSDPTRQETLRRIKHAANAVGNLAKRFVFDVVVAYAATIEEICDRVLDGEINMNKKLVNAFTEIPAIFDSMVHGDLDALHEAKRHQERLQRLADSFGDSEMPHVRMENKRGAPAPAPQRPQAPVNPGPTPASRPAPMPATKISSPADRRPRPATEVMEYLDDLFVDRKKS